MLVRHTGRSLQDSSFSWGSPRRLCTATFRSHQFNLNSGCLLCLWKLCMLVRRSFDLVRFGLLGFEEYAGTLDLTCQDQFLFEFALRARKSWHARSSISSKLAVLWKNSQSPQTNQFDQLENPNFLQDLGSYSNHLKQSEFWGNFNSVLESLVRIQKGPSGVQTRSLCCLPQFSCLQEP